MNYIQITVSSENPNISDLVIADLSQIPVESIEVIGDNVHAYMPKDIFDSIGSITFPIASRAGSLTVKTKEIQHQNWNELWESNFSPVFIGTSVLIKAPFHVDLDTKKFDFVIEINPKMAFGTGHHPTTRLMIQELLKYDLFEKNVLDMGCGTGILSVLASKMGAKQTFGVEIDIHAASNAQEIVENNNVSSNVKIFPGGTECIMPRGSAFGRYDFILANIKRNVLLKDLMYYASNSFEGTKLFLSGFYQNDVKQIVKRAKDCGYFLIDQSSNEAWIHLTLEYRGKE